ncbi:hypothetical protein Tco_0711701 [Tanacetum coccineum]
MFPALMNSTCCDAVAVAGAGVVAVVVVIVVAVVIIVAAVVGSHGPTHSWKDIFKISENDVVASDMSFPRDARKPSSSFSG